jgi:transcriptional repressor NrdR
VYRSFDSLADFEAEISMLRVERGETVPEPPPRIRS